MATCAGLDKRQLVHGVLHGEIKRLLRGVYVDAHVTVDLDLQVAATALVVPPGGVVVDRTAAWLHGLDLLRRSSVFEAPPVDVYAAEGTRMRRPGVESGRRQLLHDDVTDVGGVLVTTPLRTCLDLARLMWRYDALGAIDKYLALGLSRAELIAELPRFRGFRWVTQARTLVPLGDPRAESMPESALRLHWYDALPVPPEPQLWVQDADGRDTFRLDLAARAMRYGAEFDGEDNHTSEADRAADLSRRGWLDDRGWEIDVLTRRHVYGLNPHPGEVLRAGWDRARDRHGLGNRRGSIWPW